MIFGNEYDFSVNINPIDIDFGAFLTAPEPVKLDYITTPAGMQLQKNADVFGDMFFVTSHPIGAQPYGLLIVDAKDKQPVFDGTASVRFEVRPDDTSASATYNDFGNDRNRYEINEAESGSSNGQVITWDESFYVPTQEEFRPMGQNALFITQINYKYQSSYGTLAYLEVGQQGELIVRTHVDFSWNIKQQYVIAPTVYDTWNSVRFEVYSTPNTNGYLRVYLNGNLVVEEYRATIPTADHANTMKIGIYNAFKSRAYEPYKTQVMYFDGLKKSIDFLPQNG